MPSIFGLYTWGLLLCESQFDWLSGADVWVGEVLSWCSTLKSHEDSSSAITKYFFYYRRQSESVTNACILKNCQRMYFTCVHVHALLPPDGHYQLCVSAGSSLCPHVFRFHYYLIAANKQLMPLNWGNTLYPDTRLSNHLDFLSLSSSSYGKQNTWRSSTDNTEAHYLLHTL